MKLPSEICYFFLLITCCIIASSGHHLGGHSNNRIRSISDVFRGYNRPSSYDRDLLFDVHCYDTIGVRTIHDDCWHSPKTTDIVIRSRDETSRINSRRFALVDPFGGNELIEGYPDAYETDILVSPTGLGINCFDTTGVRIQYDDCWTSPRTRNILVTGRGSDTQINSRHFGAASTYYGGRPLVSLVEEVEDCSCVTQDRYYGDSRGVLYVKMRPEYVFTTDIRTRLLSLNWADLNGCVPYDVIEVPYLPYVSNDYRLY